MAEAKPFASLSSGLLARKGAAKPAMRPQGFGQMGMGLEDLGWNDMGHGAHAQPNGFGSRAPEPAPEHQPSSIAALTPAPRSHLQPPAPVQEPESVVAEPAPPPPVVEQQRAVEAAFAPPAPEPASPKPAEVKPVAERAAPKRAANVVERRAPGGKAKAAFTLRLDPERHLRLRLACAVKHRSAQQIVSEALEAYLAKIPEVTALASHLPAAGTKSN